jgi:hypothetical protein
MFPQICDPLLGSCDVAVTPLPDAASCGMSCMAVARTLEAAAQGTLAPAAVRQAWPVDPGNPLYNAVTSGEADLSQEF